MNEPSEPIEVKDCNICCQPTSETPITPDAAKCLTCGRFIVLTDEN